jgi:hypothetical protein
MKLAAVNKARYLAIIELDELNIKGTVRLSDCVAPIAERYKFDVFPQNAEDFDLENKGVKFESGKDGDLTIDSLVLYNGAIYVDTFASTADSQRILVEMLEWGSKTFGLSYSEGMIRKCAYISQVLFYTDFPLLVEASPALKKLAQKTSSITEGLFGGLVYEPLNLSVGHDPMARKHGIASFYIQHRINTLFAENKYFSEAPLPTDQHIKFLEEFEADVLESLK